MSQLLILPNGPQTSILPVCPICEKVLGRRPVSFVNGKPWCRACFVLMMKVLRMQTWLALPMKPGDEP